MRVLLTILFVSLCLNGLAQKEKRINLELQLGPGAGWWTYHQGIDPITNEALSWDKSRAAPIFSLSVLPSFKIQKFELGIELSALRFYEERLRTSPTGSAAFRTYELSKRFVSIQKTGLTLAYSLTSTEKVELLLNSSFGLFTINSLHPRRMYFDTKTYLSFGMKSRFSLGPGKLIIALDQSNHYINTIDGRDDEKHKLILLSWQTGYSFNF